MQVYRAVCYLCHTVYLSCSCSFCPPWPVALWHLLVCLYHLPVMKKVMVLESELQNHLLVFIICACEALASTFMPVLLALAHHVVLVPPYPPWRHNRLAPA